MILFYICFAFLESIQVNCLTGCFSNHISGSQSGYMLGNSSFKTENGITFSACLKECILFKLCSSLNFIGNKECELNVFTSSEMPEEYVPNKKSIYIDKSNIPQTTVGVCKDHACPDDTKCISTKLSGSVCVKQEHKYKCGKPLTTKIPTRIKMPSALQTDYNCINRTGDNAMKHCPISNCDGTRNWTQPTVSCSEKDCFSAGGVYNGKVSCTSKGVTCQNWLVDTPHISNYKTFGDNNYCRASEDYSPWCYTLDENLRWDYCPVPKC